MPFFKPGRSAENCKHWIKACSRLLEQMNMNIIDNNRLGCTKVSTKDHLLPSPSERSKVSQSLFILPPKPMAFYFAKAKLLLFFLFFFFVFFWGGGGGLLSHQLCRPQRHCSRAARPGIPHLRPHPGLIAHRGPAPRGPQEVTSDRW